MLLHEWSKAYPASALRQERFEQTIETERRLGRSSEMFGTAREMVADDPAGTGNYWICLLTINLRETSRGALLQAERSAKALLVAGSKPVAVGQQAWEKQRAQEEILAHRTFGWIALCRQDWPKAEQEFTLVLRSNPQDGEASYWIGNCWLARGKPDQALYHLARSVYVQGENSVSAAIKDRLTDFIEQLYWHVYGDLNGLEALQRAAHRNAFP